MKFLLLVLAVALAALLTNCTSTVYKPVDVIIPVSVPCDIKEPQGPIWPTYQLRESDMAARVKALAAENEIRKGYEGEILAALRGCIAKDVISHLTSPGV